MKHIKTWPVGTVPDWMIRRLLRHYHDQQSYDHNFGGQDKRGVPPTQAEMPELYAFLEALGYDADPSTLSGNYFETNMPYPIHADTSKNEHFSLDYTVFLIPLSLEEQSHSYLFLLDQEWMGQAATLTGQRWPQGWNELVTDYNDPRLVGRIPDEFDHRLATALELPFSGTTLEGMSVDTIYRWRVGSMISFPCNKLHFSITKASLPKIGLSLRMLPRRI